MMVVAFDGAMAPQSARTAATKKPAMGVAQTNSPVLMALVARPSSVAVTIGQTVQTAVMKQIVPAMKMNSRVPMAAVLTQKQIVLRKNAQRVKSDVVTRPAFSLDRYATVLSIVMMTS